MAWSIPGIVWLLFLSIAGARASDGRVRGVNGIQDIGRNKTLVRSHNQLVHHFPPIPLTCDHPYQITFGISGAGGGFGDRLRGLVTTFYHALLTNSSFSIDWKSPYDLNQYFHLSNCLNMNKPLLSSQSSFPHQSQRTQQQQYAPVTKKRIIDHWNYYLLQKYLTDDLKKNLRIETNSYHWSLIVQTPAFANHVQHLHLAHRTPSQLFQIAIDSIFLSPTEHLQRAYDHLLHLMGGTDSYLGVQLRFGGNSVRWTDPPRQPLESIECYVHEVIRLCDSTGLKAIFLTGDSDQANERFKQSFALHWKTSGGRDSTSRRDSAPVPPPVIYENKGEIAHTDRTTHVSNEAAWLKSVLDWWMLRHARVLVISRSGYGETASWASTSLLVRKGGKGLARTLMDNCTFVNTFSLRLEETVDRMFIS
jgi:hypothetical protein